MHEAAYLLAELGAIASSGFWMPVLAWTMLALLADATLRLVRPSASVGLWVRGALLAVLPALLIASPVLARWIPSIPSTAPALSAPPDLTLSLDAVGSLTASAPSVPMDDLLVGLATVLAVVSAWVALGVLAGSLLWLRRYRRALDTAAAPIQADAQTLSHQFGLRQPVAVAVSEPTSAPFTMGWRHPVVAVPQGLHGEPLQLALAHEIAHVRHAHFGWHLAERVLRAGFMWHPMVHLLGRGLALDRERIADAAVLRLWPERAECYGRLLIAFASNPSPGLALGASSSTLVHRLTAMTTLRPDRRRLARFAGLAVFLVPVLVAAATLPDPPPPPALRSAPLADSVPADTLREYIEHEHVRSNNGQNVKVEIRLKSGTPRDIAIAIADTYSDGDLEGELVVLWGSERITRSSINRSLLPPPPPRPRTPPPSETYIENRNVRSGDRGVRVEITLKAGTSRSTALGIADYYSGGDIEGELVVIHDDNRITRSTLRADAVPPPPPPPPAPEPPPPPPAAPEVPPAPVAPPAPPERPIDRAGF